MANTIIISNEAFSPSDLLAQFTQASKGAGAIVSFTGLVRADDNTETLTLSHYPGFTEGVIESFVKTVQNRWSTQGVSIYHRVGEMKIGESIVFVGVSSAHRRDAFEACDYLMDMLKSEAPFWKQEHKSGSAVWIEPREADLTDKQRWSA